MEASSTAAWKTFSCSLEISAIKSGARRWIKHRGIESLVRKEPDELCEEMLEQQEQKATDAFLCDDAMSE